jgi:7-cyano-7-deazaguanine synthase
VTDCVAILSGGLDSTTLVYKLVEEGNSPLCLSFDYGQRHFKELNYAERTCERYDLDYSRVDLSSITGLLAMSNSVLVDKSVPVPEGHYAHDNMSQTVVPNRNMIMLSIAAGVAVANGHKFVATGVHAGDHYQYPDCRPEFIKALSEAILVANEGFIDPSFEIKAPFLRSTKAQIAEEAYELAVPLNETWSCYMGGGWHCGKCGTCVERLEAIHEAATKMGVDVEEWDQTEYEDTEYWKRAIVEYNDAH